LEETQRVVIRGWLDDHAQGFVIGVGWLLTVQPDFVLNDTWNAISPGQ